MRVGIAADHRGFELKNHIIPYLLKMGMTVEDFSAAKLDPADDYPDIVFPLAKAVSEGVVRRGIAIGATGIGACMTANKVRDVRAALISDILLARRGVEDDNMNVICLGAEILTPTQAISLVRCFLASSYKGEERFERRLTKLSMIEDRDLI